MKYTIRENIQTAYSLHDRNVIAFEVEGDTVRMKIQGGMVRTAAPFPQVGGYVEFRNVDFLFCSVYLFDTTGNAGTFTGEKMPFLEFIRRYKTFGFSIVDEVYGYNQTKYWGYLTADSAVKECIIEFYHAGDMFFVEE